MRANTFADKGGIHDGNQVKDRSVWSKASHHAVGSGDVMMATRIIPYK